MGSLLDKAMNEEDANQGSSSNAPQSGGGSLLEQAMSNLGNAAQQAQSNAHQQFNDAASQMSPDDLHRAATNAVQSMPAEQQTQLSNTLTNQGAAEGAGVPANTKEPSEIGKMIGWVHHHVPGGVPGALGLVGAAGVAAGGAYVASQNPDVVKDVKQAASSNSSASDLIDGTTAHSVLGALQNSITNQIKKG